MPNMNTCILAIESSCDDTGAAVLRGNEVLSNLVASQEIHRLFGGVVPELASRDHQKNIVPVVSAALKAASVQPGELSAIAVTQGPGLSGSLLVGISFAKSLALALNIPLIGVNHMQAHILAHFIQTNESVSAPEFPFICLTVSGGHTQLVIVRDHLAFEIAGQTIDDAVGEAFDKAAKLLGLPYPGGPMIDKLGAGGDENKFKFATTRVTGYDYSFSGIKTSFMYFLRDQVKRDENFIERNKADLCASIQYHLVKVLLHTAQKLMTDTGIKRLAVAGGVSANSVLRRELGRLSAEAGVAVFIPPFEYCTDNAAMIGIAGYYRFLRGDRSGLDLTPLARMPF
jgi:N6-L-threonylcarbamoyladenine synthase